MFAGWFGFDQIASLDNKNLNMFHSYYFLVFFLISNIIFLNILVGFLCENTDVIMGKHLEKMEAEEADDEGDGEEK